MEQTVKQYFWDRTITVKEAPSSEKIYNSFSRACKDNSPQPKSQIFSRGTVNEKLDGYWTESNKKIVLHFGISAIRFLFTYCDFFKSCSCL